MVEATCWVAADNALKRFEPKHDAFHKGRSFALCLCTWQEIAVSRDKNIKNNLFICDALSDVLSNLLILSGLSGVSRVALWAASMVGGLVRGAGFFIGGRNGIYRNEPDEKLVFLFFIRRNKKNKVV